MNDIQVVDPNMPADAQAPVGQYALMVQMAIEKDLDIGKLEKLIAMQKEAEERSCKKEFDRMFALMQAEFVPARRTKTGDRYKYAPLEELQSTYDPIIHKFGFSYRWREEKIDDGKRCTLIISGHGHTDEGTCFDVPNLPGTKLMNPIQVAGAMSTYGRRYTYIAGFGVTVEDEDSDGRPEGLGVTWKDETVRLVQAASMEELHAAWKEIYPKVSGNVHALRYLTQVKDDRKKELAG